jgi:hypothetical protein
MCCIHTVMYYSVYSQHHTSKDIMLKKLEWLSIKQQIKALKFVHGVVSDDTNNVFRDMYKINAEIHSINYQHRTVPKLSHVSPK